MKKMTFSEAMREASRRVEEMRQDPRIIAHLRELEAEGYTERQRDNELLRLALLSLTPSKVHKLPN